MAVGIIGRKCGMTRVFDEDGASIPVTVIHASPNRITQIKDVETDGYNSLQVTTGDVKQSVSYTHLRAHETRSNLVCRLLLEKKKK